MIHFEYYPSIEYSNSTAKNILVRGKIRDEVLKGGALYYKYTVQDHMKPELISYKYYGSPNYVWAIYYANNIFDPVNDWVKSPGDFEKYIKQKYGTIEGAMRVANSDGTMNWDNVHHFIEIDPDDKKTYIIDRYTFEKKLWEGPYRGKTVRTVLGKDTVAFDYENQTMAVTLPKGTAITILAKENYELYGKKHRAEVSNIPGKQFLISLDAVQNPAQDNIMVKAVTFYEYEKQLNDKKRDIIVLDKNILMQLVNELRNLFVET